MDKYTIICDTIDDIILSPRLYFEIASLLLENMFDFISSCSNKHICKFLVDDFYKILDKKQNEYLLELNDYSKNADQHYEIQMKKNKIILLMECSQKKTFHDEIIYFMNILS